MEMGKVKRPRNRSENAMFMTKNRLLLRSFLLKPKRTSVRKFPLTMKTSATMKTLHTAIPCALVDIVSVYQ